ncbi:HlyD family secretion protein [Acetobacteraceae bacterium]|nr:HlyD family secretion protein [Acetobacteraceae bacterium]
MFLILGILAVIGVFFWWYLHRNEEETDDAYVTGRKVSVAPHVSGYVYELLVNDNQFVHKGDVLIRVDGRDYLTQLHNAEGQLAQAQANFNAAVVGEEIAKKNFPGQLMSAQGEVADAQANLFKSQTDYARQHRVLRAATSQSDIDASTAQLESAEAKMAEARGHLIQAEPVRENIKNANMRVVQGEAQIKSATAALEKAKLDVAWLTVQAPCDGWISQRSVERGNFVQAGQKILSIVPKDIWVISNYKETQLKKMRPGQEATIHVDAYPQLRLKGHVDSFQMGTGESFSTFPPENATGNFVKVVQRVPVKILIDKGLKDDLPLPLGLSLTTIVDVGYTPANPPKVQAPESGKANENFNLEEMINKSVADSGGASTQAQQSEKTEKPLDLESPKASSPFNSAETEKSMDQSLSNADAGTEGQSPVDQMGNLAEKDGQDTLKKDAAQALETAAKDLPPAEAAQVEGVDKPSNDAVNAVENVADSSKSDDTASEKKEEGGEESSLQPIKPEEVQAIKEKALAAMNNLAGSKGVKDIKDQAVAAMEALGIPKESIEKLQEKEANRETALGNPIDLKDPNTQAALGRMAKEAVEGIKTLPISSEKKAEIEKTVNDLAQKNAKAWKKSPPDRLVVKDAVKQAASGGDRKYAIDPELSKELVKAATNRDGKHKTPKTGQEAEDAVTEPDEVDESAPGSSVNNKQNEKSYQENIDNFSSTLPAPEIKTGTDSNFDSANHNFDTGNVKTEGSALGANPLGAGIH